MPELVIYGASEDLVEASGIEGADEFNCDASWIGVIEAPNGDTALVYVDYRDSGCWTVALGRYEEDFALPTWPVRIVSDDEQCTYSTLAVITVPDGTTIREMIR